MRRALATLLLVAATSCGPCDLPPVDGDAGPEVGAIDLDAQALCVTLHRGFYRQLALPSAGNSACATPSDEPVDLARLDDEEVTASFMQGCQPGNVIFDGLKVALDGGRVRFNLAEMEACNAAGRAVIDGAPISAANAEARMAQINAAYATSQCTAATTGLVEAGDPCEQPWDCADRTLACEPDSPTGASRTCRTRAADGEPCLGAVGSSLRIRSCADGLSCQGGVCTAKLPEGEPCAADADCQQGLRCAAGDVCRPPSDQGGPCEPYLHTQCVEGLFCRADETCGLPVPLGELCGSVSEVCADCAACRSLDGEVRCRAPPVAGQGCGGTFDCGAGLWCDDSGGPGQCLPVVGDGGDCSASMFACADGLDCTDDVCRARVGVGEDCTVARCEDEFHCVDGACRAGGLGDPCANRYDCDDGLGMVCTAALVCGPRAAPGGQCSDDDQCATDLFCDQGACRALPGASEPCAAGACAAGSFCDTTDTCAPKRASGEPCTANGQCSSGFCAEGTVCGVTPVSCWGAPGIFENMLFFAVLWPLRVRRLWRPVGSTSGRLGGSTR